MKNKELIGTMDRVIVIQQQNQTRDEHGGISIEWENVQRIWAAVMPREVKEKFLGEREAGITRKVYVIRFNKKVAETRRIYDITDCKPYDVVSVQEFKPDDRLNRQTYTAFVCELRK